AFVVIENRFIRWVRSRGIDLSRHAFARQVAIFRIEFPADATGYLLKIDWGTEAKAAKEYAAMFIQLLLYRGAIVPGPFGQIDMIHGRLNLQRKLLPITPNAFAYGAELS